MSPDGGITVDPPSSKGKPGTSGGRPQPGVTPQDGLKKVGETANPRDNGSAFTDTQRARETEAWKGRIDTRVKPRILKLGGDEDRRVVVRLRNDRKLVVDFPDQNDPKKRVSLIVAGVTADSGAEQVAAAITKLCADPRKVPYVYDSGMRPVYNHGGNQGGAAEPKTIITERESFMRSIEGAPPVIKELIGMVAGIWFETLGKLGLAGEQIIDAVKQVAVQITASPQAWKHFVDTSFAGDDRNAKLCRAAFAKMPEGGADDGMTIAAIFFALETKISTSVKALGPALLRDPQGVAKKVFAGLEAVVKQEGAEWDPAGHSNMGGFLGTTLAKTWNNLVPLALVGAAGSKLVGSLIRNSPKLLQAMGAGPYKAAVATLDRANARLAALAVKAGRGGGLTAAERGQQNALQRSTRAAVDAAAANDAGALKTAVRQTAKVLDDKTMDAVPQAKPAGGTGGTAGARTVESIKAEVSQALVAAKAAEKRGDLAGFTAQVQAVEKLRADSAASGHPALAEALGVHVKDLDARRKAMQWKLGAPAAMAGGGRESAQAAVARIGAMTGTPRQRSYEAQVYMKSQLKSEAEIDGFVALLKADPGTNAVAKDADFQRAVGQAKRALGANAGLQTIQSQLENCTNYVLFKAYRQSLAQQSTRPAALEVEVQKLVLRRATALADQMVGRIQGTTSRSEFYTLVQTDYRMFANGTLGDARNALEATLGPEAGSKVADALVTGAKRHNGAAPLSDVARSLAATIKASGYGPHIVAEIKRRAPSAEWPAIKAILTSEGVRVPSDDVLNHIVSVNVPKGRTTDTYRHAAVAGPRSFLDEMKSAETAILRPLTRPEGRVVSASPLRIMRDPLKHLQQAFPELNAGQLRNIFRAPGTRYTRDGAPTIERTLVPNGKTRPDPKPHDPLNTRGALEEVYGTDSNGRRVVTGYVLDEMLFTLKPQSRAGAMEPYILFRGDTRPPEYFMRHHMLAKGSNLDPLDHVYSNGEIGDSGFVAASESLPVAMSYHGDNVSYVYVIRNKGSISKDFSIPGGFPNQYEHMIPGGVRREDIVGYYKVQLMDDARLHYSKLMPMPKPAPGTP